MKCLQFHRQDIKYRFVLTIFHVLFLFEYQIPRCNCLESHFYYLSWFINILEKQPSRATSKEILPKFTNTLIKKYLWMNSQREQTKITKIDIFQWGFSRILLTTQQYIQNISKTQERQIATKILRGCFSDKKYMFENIRVFNFRK